MHNALICYQLLMYSKEFTVESQVIFVALSIHACPQRSLHPEASHVN